jgi:uncharacterized protein YndB with AHSA1/START domain
MNKIIINSVINAAPNKVWQYYTSPEHITQWNFADPSWCCPSASNDMRVGGKYIARMEARDGSFGFDFEAVYDEIEEGKRFAYTAGDRQVIVVFEVLGEQTKVIVSFDPENENPIEMQQQGWQSILDNFKQYVENN